eukprot:TRINITY_DN44458_c0_g1_i1.p1 TRINITY_DN44458_c0_g1~~TRINITY_DN44458_c0_g1_i1.p1  ORF type:complete len:330 (+),score=46.24 TRINITY_DN44458_c0_g1_i1:87-1076(+)
MNVLLIILGLFLLKNTSAGVAVVLVLGVVALFAANLIMSQESMLYVPCVRPGMQTPSDNPEGFQSPADRGLEYEDVNLRTADGVHIHAWFMPVCSTDIGDASFQSAPTVLFCHANAGNMGLRVPNFAQMVEKLKVNILAIDYRGYGKSQGSPSEDGLIEDALAAWRWLLAASDSGRIDGQNIFLFGRSLGGAVAVALATVLQQQGEQLPRGIILENTFVSVSAVVDALFPFIAFESLKARFLRLRWETVERIKTLEVPLLFLVGEKDEMIPPWHSKKLQSSAHMSPLQRSVIFPEGSHNDTWEKGGTKYWECQADFIDDCNQLRKEVLE